jgi:legumain
MKHIIFIFVLITLAVCEKWAVLIAGSHTWANYRHQADVYHAYNLLIKQNFNPSRIITFAYDDIAHNIKNPIKGKVFNKPTFKDAGVDVY